MQTILGSGGAIGTELAKALVNHTKEIRLVSRNPQKVNPDDELFSADLLDPSNVAAAIAGSEIVYVTIGFAYNTKAWQDNWPRFMRSVLDACLDEGCKLVFFDNIYMYDPAHLNPMNEETPINPSSEKGKVRARVVQMIQEEMQAGELKALIARCADYYGPGIQNTSMLTETVIKNLAAGKTANWLGGLDYKHAYTYTVDAGQATALLGNTDDAYGQVWHLPTADAMTGREFVNIIASELGVKPKVMAVPKLMVRSMGLFVPIMKELVEMHYQYDRDYVFDSSKFMERFDIKPTPYLTGIQEIVAKDYGKTDDIQAVESPE
jgi:nucleoside-diphosphate-sugar epimerase